MLRARLSMLTACLGCLLWASGRGQEVQQQTRVSCDDKGIEELVDAALVKLNGMLKSGNQYALYQILEVKKAENESGTEVSLHFTSMQSDCPIGGDKAWRDCEYFKFGPHKPMSCKAKVFVTEGGAEVIFVDCAFEPEVTPEKARCLGCPENIDLASEDLKDPLSFSVGQANNAHNEVFLFMLKNVVSASRQVVAGFRYRLKFNMHSSNCTKEEFKEVTDACHPDEKPTYVKCNSTIDVAPWRHTVPEGSVNCEPGLFIRNRRRPPGWTPLRTAVKESSEEEQDPAQATETVAANQEMTAAPPTTTPMPQSTTTETTLNCPSKPWKQFVPWTPPTAPSTDISSSLQPDGVFSDLDLLG
ncbi:hypothetical protein ACEWY4_014417 [Coilia grayii]|uniref:Cystatin kininogen-type domain-containing protein n=1 Tax=Coilia grayii TaxID=363190 RepID=A0ABD1JS74_9TELE